eukprot:gene8490-5958_t
MRYISFLLIGSDIYSFNTFYHITTKHIVECSAVTTILFFFFIQMLTRPMLRLFLSRGCLAITTFRELRRVSNSTTETTGNRSTADASILLNRLNRISSEQRDFLFGSAEKSEPYSSLFDTVNGIYADKMKHEQRSEIDLYIEKQRDYYMQRLGEEVAEFMNEHSDRLKDYERHELDHFQNELLNDTKEFSDQRQKECRMRLEDDIRKYQLSVIPVSTENEEITNRTKDIEQDSSLGCDALISAYVDRRHNFYEQLLNNEIVEFMHKRKLFYEELLQTRLSRKAENARQLIEEFQANREAYHKAKLERDAEWMSNSFQGHYEKCFLQCFARYSWLCYRREKIKHGSDHALSIPDMVKNIPLSIILDEYEKETMSDIGRDTFLKAARRLS